MFRVIRVIQSGYYGVHRLELLGLCRTQLLDYHEALRDLVTTPIRVIRVIRVIRAVRVIRVIQSGYYGVHRSRVIRVMSDPAIRLS